MYPIQIIGPATVSPEALLRLQLLLAEQLVSLGAVSDIVTQDGGLKTHVLQLARDTIHPDDVDPSVLECVVEIGIERLRESLRQTRFQLKAN